MIPMINPIILKYIIGAKISIEKEAEKKPDKNGQGQGHADGRSLVASREQLFQKLLSVFVQLFPRFGSLSPKYFFSHVPSYHTPLCLSQIFLAKGWEINDWRVIIEQFKDLYWQ